MLLKNGMGLIFLLTFSVSAYGGLFSFMKCEGGGEGESLCRFCIASSAGGSNKVCSKPYNQNLQQSGGGPDVVGKSFGLKSLSEELADDFANKLIEIKKFPKENFDVKEFYEKYAEYSCERGEKEIEDIDLQVKKFEEEEKNKDWQESQIKYLRWKRKKIVDAMAEKSCPKK